MTDGFQFPGYTAILPSPWGAHERLQLSSSFQRLSYNAPEDMWLRSKLFWKICGLYLLPTLLVLGALTTALRYEMDSNSRSTVEENLRKRLSGFQSTLEGNESPIEILQLWAADKRSIHKLCFVLSLRPNESLPSFEVTTSDSGIDPNGDESNRILPEVVQRTLWRNAGKQPIVLTWDTQSSDVLYAASRLGNASASLLLVLRHDVATRLDDDRKIRQSAVYVMLLGWTCGAIFLVVLGLTVIRPVHCLLEAVSNPDGSLERRDAMLRLREYNDEIGNVGQALEQLDKDRQTQQLELRSQVRSVRESTNQMSAMLQAMVEGVIAIDKEQSILFANDVACRLMDLDNLKAIGRPLFECVRSTVLLEAVSEALTSGETVNVEFRTTRNDTHLNLVVSNFATGGVVMVLHDVTEIRRLESLRKDFMNGVSHELKTPLTVIQACTDTMLNGAIQDPETARRFLQKISTQSERLHQLIVGMLQLSRVESGQQVFMEEAVDLATISREQMNQLQPVADAAHVHLNYDGPEEAYVLGDQQAIRTIVNNLIDNALKYTNYDGTVSVLVREEADAISLCVQDNGVGISHEDQARIFERFYRVEKDRNRERGGTGLGLAIVKHLCHALQAEVSVRSEQGSGTDFTVRFPFRDDFDEE